MRLSLFIKELLEVQQTIKKENKDADPDVMLEILDDGFPSWVDVEIGEYDDEKVELR